MGECRQLVSWCAAKTCSGAAFDPGQVNELVGVGQGRVGVLEPGEHPGQLAAASLVVEPGHLLEVTLPSLLFTTA